MAGTLCQQVTMDKIQAKAEHAVWTPLYSASLLFFKKNYSFTKEKLKLWTLRQRLHCFGGEKNKTLLYNNYITAWAITIADTHSTLSAVYLTWRCSKEAISQNINETCSECWLSKRAINYEANGSYIHLTFFTVHVKATCAFSSGRCVVKSSTQVKLWTYGK